MIPPIQIIRGNLLIARFEGMYYRKDWPDKYKDGYWVPTHEHFRTLPIEQLKTKDILFIGTNFEYHKSWSALIEAWMKYQEKYQSTYPKHNMMESEYFKEFTTGIANNNIIQAWKGLAKGCHNYLTIFNI